MTSERHQTLRANLSAFALGSLDAGEAAEIELHLPECAECRALLREYDEVVRLLPHALPVVAPSPASRATLLQRLRDDEPVPISAQRMAMIRWTALAAGLAILLVATMAYAAWGRTEPEDPAGLLARLRSEPSVQMLAMAGSEHAPNAAGQLVVNPGDTRAALLVSGLPQLPQGSAYQFWFVQPDNTRVSGGVFSVDANGWAIVEVDAPREFSRAWRCGVTEEPASGSPAPTGRNVLIASYDAPPGADYGDPG